MSEHRTINLNTVPLKLNKQHRKNYLNFHLRSDGLKIVGKESDIQECKSCHKILPSAAFTTHAPRADGAWYLKKICRECHTVLWKEQRDVRKIAPPKSDHCDCCGAKVVLQGDHIHGTLIFRGWVCRSCNTGIGALGDNLEGVLQAAIYLEPNTEKIIEKLNGIK
jgi:cytochrome c2